MSPRADRSSPAVKKVASGTPRRRPRAGAPSVRDEDRLLQSCECWLLGDWAAVAKLAPDGVAAHADRVPLMLLAAGAALRASDRDAAQRHIDRAREWGAAKKTVATVLMAATQHGLGSTAVQEDGRAEKHLSESLRSMGVDEALAVRFAQPVRVGAPEESLAEAARQMAQWLRSQQPDARRVPPVVTSGGARIGVLSGYYPGVRFNSQINHRLYCGQHGYRYIFDSTPRFDKRTYMRKLEAVREYLGLFDWLFWIDDDAYFTDFSVPLERFIEQAPEADFIVCKSPSTKEVFTRISSGQFLLRNTGRAQRFVDDALAVDLQDVQKWWKSHLGLFTKGDQDALVYLLETQPEYEHPFFSILDHQCFNNRDFEYADRLEEHFLVHFTGKQKQRDKARFCQRLQCNEYLSPAQLVDELALR